MQALLGSLFAVEIFADEDHLVGARLIAPRRHGLAIEQHVDPLEHEPLVLPLDRKHALHPVDVSTLLAQPAPHPIQVSETLGCALCTHQYVQERGS